MAQVPSKRWTAFDVLSSARELAKTVDQKKVLQEQGKYFYKIALSEIVALLNSSTDPSYFTSTGLTNGTNIARIIDKDNQGGNIVSSIHTGSLHTIVLDSDFGIKAGSIIILIAVNKATGALHKGNVLRASTVGTTITATLCNGDYFTYDSSVDTLVMYWIDSFDIASSDRSPFVKAMRQRRQNQLF